MLLNGSAKIDYKYYQSIGRMLVKKEPEKAAEYMRLINACSNEANQHADFSRIPHLFTLFCNSHGYPPSELRNSNNNTIRPTLYRVFICSMLHLYLPEIFTIPIKDVRLSHSGRKKTGTFLGALHTSLNISKSALSHMIRESIAWDKKYQDFHNQVSHTLLHYKNYHRNGK